MTRLPSILTALCALFLASCASVSNTSTTSTPATTTLKIAKIVAPSLKAGMKIAGRAIARNNPQHISDFQLSSAAASVLLNIADPTAENFKAAITQAMPKLSAADASDIADVLAGAWASFAKYLESEGVTLSLTALIGDSSYKQAADLFLGAIVEGFNAGLAETAS